MDLFPVAQILPGCSADCPRSIIPRGANNFAYCSPRSVLLFSGDARYIPNISPDAAAAAPPANNLPNPRTPLPPPVSVSAYNLRNVFGAELPGNLIAVDMNEEYVAGLTRSTTGGGGQAVRLWRAATGEDVSRTKLHPTLHDVLAREGGATTMCVAGKHHLLFGTQYGKLISLNTNENHEPRCVAMPPPPALNGQKVGAITAIAVSPVRADIVAAGTADGCLAFFSLNAATGLNPTGVLLPFGTTSSSSSSNTNNTSSTASASTFANNASSSNITSGAVEKHPISALSFDVVNQNYLAVGTIDGGLVLCDVMASSIVASFSYKEAPEANKVSSLTWIRGETGAFYSASSTTNKMFKWSINAKTPVAAFCPAEAMTCERTPTKVGVVSCATLEKDRVVVALTTGAVKVFSVAAQRVVFQSADAAPRGVLSDVSISPYDRDFAASCGADGNLYVHNLRQMSLHYVVRPLADQQPQHRHAHSVAWSPNGKLIAVSFSSGEVVAYAISTRRLAWRTQVFAKAAVRMEWAPTSASDSILVVSSAAGEVALLSTKEGKIQRRFVPSKPHVGGGTPTPARGALAVELITTGVMAVANCVVGDDHNICLFSVSQGAGEEPWMILSGHTGTVHDVSFNPSLPNLLVSASADSTIRVWDLSSRDARTIHASARVLSAGTQSGAITSLGWCSIAPYLLLSGGEGGLRVWDVRSGAAITTVASSTSPSAVCSISSSPERPTIFATASQDGAVVLWQLGALRGIAIHAALGALDQAIVSDASQLFTSSTPSSGVMPFKGTGAAVERLAKELRENTNAKPAERMAKVLQFFDLPIGAVDLAHMASFASDPTTFAVDGKDVVQPASKLLDARRARAKQIVDKARGKSATAAGVEYQRERLVEAAEEVLRVGNFEEHCQLLMEAEQWDRAIAVAPIVSREFWRNACIRAGEAMEASGDATRAMTYFIMGEESTRAARLAGRFRHDQLDAGIAVEQSCPQRNLAASVAPGTTLPPGAVPPETSHCTTVDANGVSAQVKELQRERLTSGLERFNSPRLFAAAQVSNGKGDAAVRLLENAGDVVAAHLLVHTVPLQEQGSIDAAYRMTMLLCARQGFWETALLCSTRLSNPYDGMATVLALYQSSLAQQHQVHQMPQHVMLEKLRTFTDQVRQESQKLQLPLDANMIQQRHASDGLASQNQLAAMVMSADAAAGPITSSMILQSVSGFMESLLQVALQDADGANTSFYLTQALHVSQYVSLPVVRGANNNNNNAQAPGSSIPSLPNAATTTSMGQLSPEHRKFLALALLTSALMCVKVFRFPKLLNPAFAKARELAQGDAAVEALLGKAQPLLGAYSTHSVELDCNTEGGLIAMMNERGQTRTSTITGEPIFGALHVCDDGQSVMARTEALAWAQCCAFSPLGTGARHIAA